MHYANQMPNLRGMATTIEARTPDMLGHFWRVSQFARLLATDCGLADDDVARIELGGFLHDIGKIGVPDAVLNKADKLTAEEYDAIKIHPVVGCRLLAGHPLGELVRDAVLWHHERPDGNGYPHRLAGDAIPLDARIVGICDAFDAMTSTRPYRRGMAVGNALAIIDEYLDRQFDHHLGIRFLELGRQHALDAIVSRSGPGPGIPGRASSWRALLAVWGSLNADQAIALPIAAAASSPA